MALRLLDLGGDPEEVGGNSGRFYYRLATLTWSKPRRWIRGEDFTPPRGWAGHGGVYAFLRHHGNHSDGKPRIAYIGKANAFESRLTRRHNHYDIIERQGQTHVSCGRIAFERITSNTAYYEEIEQLIIFSVWEWLENTRGIESLPGFRSCQAFAMKPWVIRNEGFRFGGVMPKRIVYPSIGVDSRSF